MIIDDALEHLPFFKDMLILIMPYGNKKASDSNYNRN